MISRRLLRIKIMQLLYAYFQAEEQLIQKSEKELFFSIEKTYQLYHYLLLLVLEIVDYTEDKIEVARQKRIPTKEDLNPSVKFVENKLIKQLQSNHQFKSYLKKNKLSWVNHPDLIRYLYIELKESTMYEEYIKTETSSYIDDKKFIIDIFEKQIANSELLYQILEEQSIYWNDDIEFVISMIIKTLKNFNEKSNENTLLMDLFKNEDDIEFTKTLYRKTILNHEENVKLIEKFTKNWDVERIAFMDVLIMELAITEIMEIHSIPTKVSFNEYIEISKIYSTDKSSNFINGILDKIIDTLKKENKIKKQGRGLIGEI